MPVNEHQKPLTWDEIQELDKFLLYRTHSTDELDAIEDDSGIGGISELDGLIAASCCCHEMIMPSVWIDWVWGSEEYAPKWTDKNQANHYFQLIMRHYNTVAENLMHGAEYYEPLFLESTMGGAGTMIVDEWCEGFMMVVENHQAGWEGHEADIEYIAAFTESRDFAAHKSKDVEKLQKEIKPAILRMHKRRLEAFDPAKSLAIHPPVAKVGRNDPCPCGSGKKYKKCCGWN